MSWLSTWGGVQWVNFLTFATASAAIAGWWKPLLPNPVHQVAVLGFVLWVSSIINFVMLLSNKKALTSGDVRGGLLS